MLIDVTLLGILRRAAKHRNSYIQKLGPSFTRRKFALFFGEFETHVLDAGMEVNRKKVAAIIANLFETLAVVAHGVYKKLP